MKRFIVTVVSAMFLVASSTSVRAEDGPVTLRYKMTKGEPLIYRTVTEVAQTQTVAEMKVETKLTHLDVSERTLEELGDNGQLKIRIENKRLKLTANAGPLGEYKYDSTAAEQEKTSVLGQSLTPVYDRLNGAVLTLSVTPLGEVTEMEGYAELLADVLKDNPLGAQFTAGGGDESAVSSFAEQFPRLSETPVRPGETWDVGYETELPNLGTVKGRRIYKFEGFDKIGGRKTARIGLTHEMAFELKIDVGGNTATGRIATEKSSGTIQFDFEKGQLVSMEASYTLIGDLTVSVEGQEIAVGTSQVQSLKSERLDKLPESLKP